MNGYTIIYEKTSKGYSAYVPDLPDCITTGATLQQTKANMKEAVAGHLEVMQEYGDPIPEPITFAESLPIPA